MQTIKTGVVIVLLVAVCYGAFVALNAPEPDIPEELQQWVNAADVEGLMDIEMPSGDSGFSVDMSSAAPVSGDQLSKPQTADTASLPTLPPLDTSTTPGEIPAFPAIPPASSADSSSSLAGSLPPAAPALPSLPTSDGTASPKLDGPAMAFGTAELKEGAKPAGELVSHQHPSGDPSLPGGDWQSTEIDLPLLTAGDTPAASATQPQTITLPTMPFEIARDKALHKAKSGELKQALEMLSPFYESPELDHSEHSDLVDILDALTREVIYSPRHLMESAYTVGANETIDSVAAKYSVSPDLLAAVNGLQNSKALLNGSKLKVIQGPFRAKISLNRGELTLFAGNLYAGRFPISISKENPPSEGVFDIVDRRRDRTYYGPGGVVIQADQPENPYGGYWLSLGNNLCIHGSPEMARTDLQDAGCISLAPLDAADVYSILTKDCQVEIHR